MSRAVCGLLTAALLGGLASAAPQTQRYCNPRFGYCVSVPADLGARPAPENGDGQTWLGAQGPGNPNDSVKVSVWGSYGPSVLGLDTPGAYAAWLSTAEEQDGSRLTYRFFGRTQVVLSGTTRSGQVFYQKVLLNAGTESAVRVEYPVRLKAVWDRLAVQTAASLTPAR
ncbi:hypothetical protein [Deinococcus altitudinis]|uniref:hypothetical protein n=1 Tax=Deinococcus altitudinis TaxID=468914 RepID=UPI003891FDEC